MNISKIFQSVTGKEPESPPHLKFAPPGHFYSSIPSDEDIERSINARNPEREYPGLERRFEEQKKLAGELARFYPEIPFKPQADEKLRYHYENPFFAYGDGIILHCLLRYLKPRRIVEVGSGFSSAVMLDTAEHFLEGKVQLTFIEPFPERLLGLLRDQDQARCAILKKSVQDVPLETFTALEAGDILFVDSSHVSKAGSDVNFLVFEVFPRLKPGVWIHVHDIFPDFDYPADWLREGRCWTESYLVRAFLLFNDTFEIMLHVPFCIQNHQEWFRQNMPDCLKNYGGGIWLRRKK